MEARMSSIAARTYLTPQEYLAFERKATTKHEYLAGEIVAMSGASFAHNFITGDIFGELRAQLQGRRCKAATNDMRVKVSKTGSYFYPDVVVFCGEPQAEDNESDTLLNPTVIIGVLSPSTEARDRGEKFWHYQQLASLQEYVLVSQDRVCVEHYLREGAYWLRTEFRALEDIMPLSSIECELRLRDIYNSVEMK
jgi:Uma2 family endonuclease